MTLDSSSSLGRPAAKPAKRTAPDKRMSPRRFKSRSAYLPREDRDRVLLSTVIRALETTRGTRKNTATSTQTAPIAADFTQFYAKVRTVN